MTRKSTGSYRYDLIRKVCGSGTALIQRLADGVNNLFVYAINIECIISNYLSKNRNTIS